MEITLDIPKYDRSSGLLLNWVDDHRIEVKIDNGEVVIFANRAGLESLANHIMTLAQSEVPNGRHFHLSGSAGLEETSVDLVLGKTDFA